MNSAEIPAATDKGESAAPRLVITGKLTSTTSKSRRHLHAWFDRAGFWASVLCAVHCAVVPFVLVMNPVFSWLHFSRAAELTLLAVSALIGLSGCLLSLRQHKDFTPLCLVVVGLALAITGRFAYASLGLFLTTTLVVAGPLLMAYALWLDKHRCTCEH